MKRLFQVMAVTLVAVLLMAQQPVTVSNTPSVTISGTPTVTSNAGTGTFATSSSQLPSALDGSGFLKTHEQGTATVSGTVTANQGTNPWTTQDTSDGIPGSAAPSKATQIGGTDGANTRVPYMDPCAYSAWNYYVVNAAANAQIVAGPASKSVYVCQMTILPTPAAANVNVVEGTGTTCATGTAGMLGGATAALGANVSANGGFVLPGSNRAWTKTATTGDSVCIYTSAQVSGVIAYVGPI